MDLDYDVHLKAPLVNTHSYTYTIVNCGSPSHVSLYHCDSHLPLFPFSALGIILNFKLSIGEHPFIRHCVNCNILKHNQAPNKVVQWYSRSTCHS